MPFSVVSVATVTVGEFQSESRAPRERKSWAHSLGYAIVGRGLGNVPSAPVLPYFGAVSHLRRDPVRALYAWFQQLGDLYQFSVGPERHVIVSSPERIEQILKGNYNDWQKNAFYDPLKLMLGSGLLTSEGQKWHSFRRLAQPAFHRQRLAGYVTDIARTTQQHLDNWGPGSRPVDVSHEFMSLTLTVIARLMFGADLRTDVQVVGTSLATMLDYVQLRTSTAFKLPLSWPTPHNRRARRAVGRCHDIIDRIVAQRHAIETPSNDLLELLMSARDKDTGAGLTDTELRDQAITILMAGHETTALTLAWCVELLARHPDVQRVLEREVTRVLGDRLPTFDDVSQLSYTGAVINETLRLYPPIWYFGRQPVKGTWIGDIPAPRWLNVGISPYIVHRHPAHWVDPETFRPERFLETSAKERHPFAFIPFGGGPRSCIGDQVALLEAKVILAMLVQRSSIELFDERQNDPKSQVTLRPGRPIVIRAVQRDS